MYAFEYEGNRYFIKKEQARQYHFEANLLYYATKNGKYIRGTTARTAEGSLILLTAHMDEKKIVWTDSFSGTTYI